MHGLDVSRPVTEAAPAMLRLRTCWCATTRLAQTSGTRYSQRVMDRPQAACGPHAEIVRTDALRISRCPCGTVHVHFAHNGLTVQLSPEHFAEAAQAMSLARSLLSGDAATRPLQGRVDHPAPGRFVTVATYDPKKSPNN